MSTRERILELLADRPNGATSADLRPALAIRDKTVENALGMLRTEERADWLQVGRARVWFVPQFRANVAKLQVAARQASAEHARLKAIKEAQKRRDAGYNPVKREATGGLEARHPVVPSIWALGARL